MKTQDLRGSVNRLTSTGERETNPLTHCRELQYRENSQRTKPKTQATTFRRNPTRTT